jgi:hypothetical protein
MDPYASHVIYNANQNLRMEEEERKYNPEEVIRSFTKFIKEYQLGNSFIYR